MRRIPMPAAFAVAVVVAVVLPSSLSASSMVSASVSLIYGIAGLSVVVITGWTGQTSLAQVTFMGVGAYVTARLMLPEVGLPLYIAIPLGMLAAAAGSVIVGLPALRLRGIYLAIVTLGFAQVMEDAVFNNATVTQSQNGLYVARPVLGALDLSTDRTLYYLLLAVLVGCCGAVALLRRSALGQKMVALRSTEVGTSVRGVSLTTVKLSAFAVSAALAGLAGGLLALEVQSVGPATFNPLQSIFLLGLVVVAGERSIGAAVVAGVLYGTMPTVLGRIFTDSTLGPNATNLVAGAGLLAVLVGREHLAGLLQRVPRRPRPWLRAVRSASNEVLRDAPA